MQRGATEEPRGGRCHHKGGSSGAHCTRGSTGLLSGLEGSVREGDLRKGHWIGASRVVLEIGDNSRCFLN